MPRCDISFMCFDYLAHVGMCSESNLSSALPHNSGLWCGAMVQRFLRPSDFTLCYMARVFGLLDGVIIQA